MPRIHEFGITVYDTVLLVGIHVPEDDTSIDPHAVVIVIQKQLAKIFNVKRSLNMHGLSEVIETCLTNRSAELPYDETTYVAKYAVVGNQIGLCFTPQPKPQKPGGSPFTAFQEIKRYLVATGLINGNEPPSYIAEFVVHTIGGFNQ